MHVHHLYADEHGVSHFGDIELELEPTPGGGGVTPVIPATGVVFRLAPATQNADFHVAPSRRYVVTLSGGILAVTASDGETRNLKPGELMLVEDTFGKGHQSKAFDGIPRETAMIMLD
jgi:hypothetical protein